MSSNTTVTTNTPTPSSTSLGVTSITSITSSASVASSSVVLTSDATTSTTIAKSTAAISTTASSTSDIDTTSTTTAAPAPASSTALSTTTELSTDAAGSVSVVTVVVTPSAATTTSATTTSSSAASTSSASLQSSSSSNSSSGLSASGKIAIAVVVPLVAVALLVAAALFFWRKRKQRKSAEETRQREIEEYGYNPNGNPTLPVLAGDGKSEMTEDSNGGYRGWGGAMSNRKPSTTMSAGHTQGLSDSGSVPGGFSTSPTAFGGSADGHLDAPFDNADSPRSDEIGDLGAAPAAGIGRGEMHRGPSNASSSYSAGHRSDTSDPGLGGNMSNDAQNYGVNQGPYGDGSYGGGDGMPVVRDVSARRNTRIEPGGGYRPGNAGIAQNF